MNILAGFADISLVQLLLVASVALFASLIGGLAGYGTGALMPLVLVPLIGAEPVVPIIAISAVFTNISRFTAYFRYIDRRRALIVAAAAALTTALGAYGYTRLTNAGAALVIGTMLISSVPLRRLARRREVRIGDSGLAASAVGYGVVVGGTSGSGVILLSLLMAAGLEGAAVIATDAVISVATSVIKISVFGLAGVVTAQVLAFALLIGIIAIPGAFLARAFVERMPVHIHTAILDAAVAIGPDGGIRRQAFAVNVDPDGIDAEALRRFDFPFQIVADHPCLRCGDAERLHGVQIGALVWFAETMLALDLDVIEPVRQRKAFDLCALGFGGAVGHQRQFHAMRFQGIDGVMRAREDEHLLFAIGGEAVGEPGREIH